MDEACHEAIASGVLMACMIKERIICIVAAYSHERHQGYPDSRLELVKAYSICGCCW